jgi:glycosyltransferase involved in cell wall biosynthesis
MTWNPRVLFVIPGEGEGSSMVFARRQAETLRHRGTPEVHCFYLRSRTSPSRLWREAKRFRAQIEAFRPDVVHAHFGTVTGLFAALLAGSIPVVVTYRGSDLNRGPRTRWLRSALGRLFSQLAALRANWIVCVSRGLRERLWWNQHRTTVLPSGVDTEVFREMPRTWARKKLGWPDDGRVVLFNAGHDPINKRLDLAIASVEAAARSLPGLRMHLLNGDVPPDHMPLYMNAADCLLVTSDAEGSPTVVQEAIATGLPVVAVDVGDVSERLRSVTPVAITTRDTEALGRALITILKTGQRTNGRLRVREISSTHIADELSHLYRQVVAERLRKVSTWSTTHY